VEEYSVLVQYPKFAIKIIRSMAYGSNQIKVIPHYEQSSKMRQKAALIPSGNYLAATETGE
jgi:hypothetical protein